MGNKCGRKEADPDSAWKQQNKEIATNPVYKFVDFTGGGKLIEAYKTGGAAAVEKIAKTEMLPYLYNEGNGAIVTKLDYIKWQCRMQAKYTGSTVWETRTDEQLLSEFKEDYFNKVVTHEACWDLNKRGGVGESPFHLLYLLDSPTHHAVGEILLNLYPKLSLDVYEGEEYFGESALHIAIVFGSLEAVKLLIKKGALIDQRCTGRFFLPEDQKKGYTKTTDYEGYAYYGEYPIHFAAATGNQEIYDYLIGHGGDPNAQDTFGNTALHMVVICNQVEMYKYIVRHHTLPAKTDIKNAVNLTPLTLASKLGRQTIFKEMLELGSLELWRYSNITCSLYPLLALDSIGPTGDTNWNSALMIIINGENDEHLEMLEGGVMRQLLDEKWKAFARRRFFVRLILAFIQLILISVAVYLRPKSNLLAVNSYTDIIRFVCEILTCIGCSITLVADVFEIITQGIFSFLKNCKNAPAQTLFMISCILFLACIPFRFLEMKQVEDVLMIIAVPCSWLFLLFFARTFKLTGPFVTMIYKMLLGDLLRFGIIYVIFLTGFTQAFYFLFRGNTSNQSQGFDDIGDTVLTLFQMTLGEFKYQDFNYTKYSGLTKIVFAIFMMLVPILLLNMLIAMMGNTYTMVIAKSEKEWRKQWAKIVVVLERGFSRKQLLNFQKMYAIKMLGPPKENLAEITEQVEEQRGLMVIKTSSKTKARQRKGAIANWKLFGKEVIKQLKKHKNKGKKEPFQLGRIKRKRKLSFNESDYSSDEDEKAKMFSMTLAQLAWERDIDLTKGKTFVTDPNLIEKLSPYIGKEEPGKTVIQNHSSPALMGGGSPTSNHQIPNGVKHRAPGERTVKKPAGTPKSSPKSATTKQFNYNRVSPLVLMKKSSPTDDSESDLEGMKPSDSVKRGMSVTDISVHGTMDSSRNTHHKMFLEDSKPTVEVKKLHWDNVPNVAYTPGYASSKTSSTKSGSVKSDGSKSKSDSEYKPSFYSKSEDGYTSQGSVESSSKASRVSRGAESVSSKTSKYSSRSTTTVEESTVSKSSKGGADCSLQEMDSETEDTSRISKVSSSQSISQKGTELETSESLAKPPKPSKSPEREGGSTKKSKHKRKKSKKSRHGSRASSKASLLPSEENEDRESQV
ncbi:uncharacterized protein LOC134272556 isoform X2 [Saccostrea cucullata]|uniref:uncharacterized protein LOC134272556 isoform X2 n=1 Tax=Saccostrea cuccullata TaxID=36930 RepID=UPI002ED1C2DD